MKPTLRKSILLLLLLCLALSLSSCYKEIDPWPVSVPLNTELPPTITATPVPEATGVPQPVYTQQPSDFWDVEPTEVPGGSVDPGLNG